MQLLNLPITTAIAVTTTPTYQIRPGPGDQAWPSNITLQGRFTYGSDGTSADAYVQTSVDGGGTWIDVANFHFTTANAHFMFNLSSATPVTTEYATTDGTLLPANTAKDGILGNLWRVKYVTTGTYAGDTSMRVDAIANGLTTLSEPSQNAILVLIRWVLAPIPRLLAQAICFFSLAALGILVVWIWNGWLYNGVVWISNGWLYDGINLDLFYEIRKGLAIFVALYAIWCVLRLTYKVALPRKLAEDFVPELIAYSIFWVLAPPIWFFVEYFAVASHCIFGFGSDGDLKAIKDYADYASKIWAGVLALLLGLIALKK